MKYWFFISGIIVGILLRSIASPKVAYNEKIFQCVFGRGSDTNTIALTIVPNPWPGHPNIFYTTNVDIGVVQFTVSPFMNSIPMKFKSLKND